MPVIANVSATTDTNANANANANANTCINANANDYNSVATTRSIAVKTSRRADEPLSRFE